MVVGANLERLVASHYQTDLFRLLVLKKFHIAGAALFPLVQAVVEAEEFRSPR
jgi:hypothetical protein